MPVDFATFAPLQVYSNLHGYQKDESKPWLAIKACDESHNNCNRQHTMKMYIQPNELSHNKGLILVVILFDTFFY